MPNYRNILLIFKPSGAEKGVPIQRWWGGEGEIDLER